MDRVLIVGTKDVMETTINALHDLNLLHVEDYIAEDEYFRIGKPLKTATPLSEKLLKLRSIKSYLGTKDVIPIREKQDKVLKELEANLGSLEQTVTKKTSEKSALESEIKELEHKSEVLKPYEALGVRPELLSGYESVAVFTGTTTTDIEPIIKGITNDYELFSAPYEKGTVISLIVPKDVADRASEALMKSNFVEAEQLRESGEPADIRKSLETKKAEDEDRLKTVNSELGELNEKYARFIVSSEELLNIDTEKAEAPLRFATSENTFVVEGWVPRPNFDELKTALEKITNDSIYVTKIEPMPEAYKGEVDAALDKHVKHHEINAPVKYNNPNLINPIEALVDVFGRPRYDEVDPTILFAIVFPLFYGFILGDVAYGLLILILTLIVKQKLKYNEGWQLLLNIMIVCSLSSIFFGFLFGEFLGFSMAEPIVNGQGGIMGIVSLSHLYPHSITIGPIGPFKLPFERLQPGGFDSDGVYVFGIKDLLVFTCIVGVCHLMLGHALGFRNELKQHGLKTAVLHKVSWASMLMGGVAMVWYIFPVLMTHGSWNLFDPLLLIGAVLFIIGFILLQLGEGWMGTLELTSLVSNVFSYTRLLAVGLSSVGIAFAINTIIHMLGGAGAIGLIGAAIVFLIGHTVNLVIGIYAPFIQSLRLHYVEFFQKFYKGGGRIYDPFGYNRRYTED
ncbi:MAG TPA: V-type ATP synthase subunit I [Methanocella sp.]|nr:V-type ATP synthase subunit I [Methanocella sp.]